MKFMLHFLFAMALAMALLSSADAGYRSREVKVQKKGSPMWVKSHFRGVPPQKVIVLKPVKPAPKPTVKVEVKVAPPAN